MTAVDTKQPDWTDRQEEWSLMRACARGEKAVKEAGEDYPPMPSGFRVQADSGRAMYAAYQKRAQFAQIVAPTISGMTGVIHRSEAQIQMPKAMEEIREKLTAEGCRSRQCTGLRAVRAGRGRFCTEMRPSPTCWQRSCRSRV